MLKRLGYQWGLAMTVGVRSKRRDVAAILREYLIKYAHAFELAKTEKYVNTSLCTRMKRFCTNDTAKTIHGSI